MNADLINSIAKYVEQHIGELTETELLNYNRLT